METNEVLHDQIMNIIDNQMNENDPPETNETFKRLTNKEGYSDYQAKQLIGQCLSVELFNVMKHGNPFDEKRYKKNLQNLPKEPFE